MDYKNLIKKLEYQAETIRNNNCTTMSAEESESAANAIEALLAERDAAVNELKYRVGCNSCAYFRVGIFEEPCYSCRKEKKFDKWKWRGPQKHD